MTSYLIIILIPTILYFIDESIVSKNGIFKKIAIAFLIAISALRFEFGADYYTYSDAFIRIQNGIMTDKFELGYKFLNIIIAKLGMQFYFLLFVIAVFNLILVYKSIEQNVNKYKWLSIFLYLVYFDLFFYSLSAIRQSIVISIIMYTFKFIENKNFKKYIIWMIFGSLFHSSALLMIPVYFLYQYLRKQNFLSTATVMVGITILYKLSIKFMALIQPFVGDKLNYYLFTFDNSIVSYSFIYIVVTEFVMLCWIYFSCFLRKKYSKEENDKSYICLLPITLFLCLKNFQYIQYYSLIPRMQLYFYCFLILAIPNIVKSFPLKLRPILNNLIFVFFIINFVFRYYEVNQVYWYCYESFKLILNK